MKTAVFSRPLFFVPKNFQIFCINGFLKQTIYFVNIAEYFEA